MKTVPPAAESSSRRGSPAPAANAESAAPLRARPRAFLALLVIFFLWLAALGVMKLLT